MAIESDREELVRDNRHLRDMLAAYALTGIMRNVNQHSAPAIAQKAYEIADAMLAERRK